MTAQEFWYTPNDFSPSYFVQVEGDEVRLLKIQDIWPGYPGAKEIPIEDHHVQYIQSELINILKKAKRRAALNTKTQE